MKGKMIAFEFMRTKIANRPMSSWLVVVNSGLAPVFFFFSSRRRHTRSLCDWSSDVCSSDLGELRAVGRHNGRSDVSGIVALLGVDQYGLSFGTRRFDHLRDMCEPALPVVGKNHDIAVGNHAAVEIGRASCRERV